MSDLSVNRVQRRPTDEAAPVRWALILLVVAVLAVLLYAPLIVVCASGQRSELAGAYLLADGARDVLILNGGLRAWRVALESPDLETVD